MVEGGFWKHFLPGRKKSMQLKAWTVLSAARGNSAGRPENLVGKEWWGKARDGRGGQREVFDGKAAGPGQSYHY